MIPSEVLAECREIAQEIMHQGKPVNRIAAFVIILIWVILATLVIALLWQHVKYFDRFNI